MNSDRRLALSCLGIAALTAIVAAVGIVLRGDGTVHAVTSPRGESYDMIATGVYAGNAERIVAEGIGWDIVTLGLAVPALIIALPALSRGSTRARLFVMGLLAYLFYQYLMYSLTWAFGPLFLPFVAIYGASAAALAWTVSTVDWRGLACSFAPTFPRIRIAALCLVMSALLVAMWLKRIATGLGGDLSEAMLLGQTTLVVQALDLGLVVPLAVFTGVATLRHKPIGYALATIFVIKMITMSIAIAAMLVSARVVEGTLEVVPFVIFTSAAAIATALGIAMYRSIDARNFGGAE